MLQIVRTASVFALTLFLIIAFFPNAGSSNANMSEEVSPYSNSCKVAPKLISCSSPKKGTKNHPTEERDHPFEESEELENIEFLYLQKSILTYSTWSLIRGKRRYIKNHFYKSPYLSNWLRPPIS